MHFAWIFAGMMRAGSVRFPGTLALVCFRLGLLFHALTVVHRMIMPCLVFVAPSAQC